MTQNPPRQVSTQNEESIRIENPSHDSSAFLRPLPEATSAIDTSEKPVREKLKKTSIASISQHATKPQEVGQEANASHMISLDVAKPGLSPAKAISQAEIDPSRGRPLKKRSFDGLEITDPCEETSADDGTHSERPNGHVRKRSRDIRTGEVKEDRLPWGVDATLQEEIEYDSSQVESPRPLGHASNKAEKTSVQNPEVPQQIGIERDSNTNDLSTAEEKSSIEMVNAPPDQEMRDPAPSPRKKRSRDQFDTEADLEQKQKIPATEGLRAQRKSDELERTQIQRANSEHVYSREGSAPFEQEPVPTADSCEKAAKIASSAPVGSTSTPSPPTSKIGSVYPTNFSSDAQSQTSAAAFATSGFAAHASSTTSPFGTLGTSSISTTAPSPFAPAATFGIKTIGFSEDGETKSTQPAVNGGFGAFAKTSSSGFGANELSPFGMTGAVKSGVFGGSVFGSAFGGGFSGAGKLTSFAAPTGDAKIGSANGAVRPIEPPNHAVDEDEDSDDEGEGLGEDDQGGADEVDARFQHQDVETGETDEVTVFSSRASLYTFKDRAWKEGGKGGFKLNVKPSDGDQSPKSGRFIMRAHQTFRVLLNAPVLKGMTIGVRGEEPVGKSFPFAVIEDGTVVPHLLKLGEAESKALYHEVRKLQQSMSED